MKEMLKLNDTDKSIQVFSQFFLVNKDDFNFECSYKIMGIKNNIPISPVKCLLEDKIYKKNLVELFLLYKNNHYIEYNFCLEGQLGVYLFEGYRNFTKDLVTQVYSFPKIIQNQEGMEITFNGKNLLSPEEIVSFQMSAIIENIHYVYNIANNQKIDFHHLESFSTVGKD